MTTQTVSSASSTDFAPLSSSRGIGDCSRRFERGTLRRLLEWTAGRAGAQRSRRIACGALLLLAGLAPFSLHAQNITRVPVISTVAGNGTQGYSGDGGAATSAELYFPTGTAVDGAGNLYIADASNNRIRKVDANGNISTVAGNGTPAYSGDGGAATSAEIYTPTGVAVDGAGNLYISDENNSRVRVVNMQSSSITVATVTIPAGAIATVAGNGSFGFSGDGGAATSAELTGIFGVAVDSAGNIYIASSNDSRIRKVTASTGIITTVAGNGTGGYNGDGGAATSAELYYPFGVAVDSAGNLYIVDSANQRIRKVTASTGKISTVAGNGTQGYSGDAGAATSAEIANPFGVAVDSAGNLYIASGSTIREVTASTGIITNVAGNPNGTQAYSGDGGAATSAELFNTYSVALDSAGNLYIADTYSNVVRKVNVGPVNFGPVAIGSNSTQNVLLSINTSLTLSNIIVNGDYSVTSNSCGPLPAVLSSGAVCTLQVKFTPTEPGQRWSPLVAVDSSSNKYSFGLEGIGLGSASAFTPGIISAVAGNGGYAFSGDGGAATSAELYDPAGVTVDSAGNLYIADSENDRIRKVTASTGNISTVAGNGTYGFSGDGGAATSAELDEVFGTAVDSAGNLYIADAGGRRIRKVDANGIITTAAGNATEGDSGDGGAATSAQLDFPISVAVDTAGNLYIADENSNRVRKVDFNGIITTVAGNGTYGYSGDGGAATSAQLYDPVGVAVDSGGNLYIADENNSRIRKVAASTGTISTVAGNGTYGYSGDGGAATSAELEDATGVAVDAAGNLYIADTLNERVRKVDASGNISTVAGTGSADYLGDGGAATSAPLANPAGVAVDSAGNLYIADEVNQRIRKVDVTTSALSFGSESVGQQTSPQSVVVSDVGTLPLSFTSFGYSTNFKTATAGSDCSTGTPLAVGAGCNLGALFAPTTTGNPLTGAITVADNAFNTPQSVNLSGVGTAPPFVTFNNTNTVAVSFGPSAFSKPMSVTAGGTGTVAFATVWVDEASGAAGTTFNVTATYGGHAMTLAGAPSYDYNYAPISTRVFYLVNPPTGSNPLTISATASSGTVQEIAANLTSYNNVNQSVPVRPGTYQALHSAPAVTVGSFTAMLASNPYDLTLGAVEQTFHFASPASNQTVDGMNGADFGVGSDHATNPASNISDTWLFTQPYAYYAYVGLSIQGAGGGTLATPKITVTGGTFAYDTNPHPATATAVGVDGVTPVSGTFAFTYTPPGNSTVPTAQGTYAVLATFTSSDPNYGNASGSGSITITSAPPVNVALNNANAVAVSFGSGTFSKPMTVTAGGTNAVAFATVWVDEKSGAPGTTFTVSATYGGVAMTSAGATSYDYNYAPISTQVFYLVGPPTGSNTLVVTATASAGTVQEIAANLTSYNGVNQTTPVRAGTYQTMHSATAATVGSFTATMTSSPSDLTLGAVEQTFHFASPASNQTVDGVNAADFGVGSDHATTGANTVADTWSFTAPYAYFAYAGLSIEAAGGGIPAMPKITVTGGTFTYDTNPHPATATAVEADGVTPVSGSFAFTYTPPGNSTVPVNPGTYSVIATFTSTNPSYSNASGTGTITINSSISGDVTLNNTNAVAVSFGPGTFSKPMTVTAGGTNTVAFATVWVDEASGAPGTTFTVTATYGGVAMASAGATAYDYNYAPISTQVFYLVNPPTGSNTLVVTATASSGTVQEIAANLVSYNGVNQSTPVRAGTYQTLHSPSVATVGSFTATIASNANDLTLGAVEQTFHFATPASNQTVDGTNAADFGVGSDHSTTGASTISDTWIFTMPYAYYAYVGFSIEAN